LTVPHDADVIVAGLSRHKHLLFKVLRWASGSSSTLGDKRELTMDIASADIITSALSSDPSYHTVMLDIDIPAKLVPSTTPGHSHLYIDTRLKWGQYEKLLIALADAKIIEQGYLGVSRKNMMTSLRLPWVRKGVKP
jgi:hypothetical protein